MELYTRFNKYLIHIQGSKTFETYFSMYQQKQQCRLIILHKIITSKIFHVLQTSSKTGACNSLAHLRKLMDHCKIMESGLM